MPGISPPLPGARGGRPRVRRIGMHGWPRMLPLPICIWGQSASRAALGVLATHASSADDPRLGKEACHDACFLTDSALARSRGDDRSPLQSQPILEAVGRCAIRDPCTMIALSAANQAAVRAGSCTAAIPGSGVWCRSFPTVRPRPRQPWLRAAPGGHVDPLRNFGMKH